MATSSVRNPPGRGRFWVTLVIALVIVFIVTLLMSFGEVQPGEVGIKVNRFTGSETVIDRPGLALVLPLIHDLYIVDTSPQTLRMEGSTPSEDLEVIPKLTVRANDGSNFWFERMTIQYQVIPEMTRTVLHERGSIVAFREWLLPTVRSILRDEFGRQSTRDVSNPATYNAATADAETELNSVLNRHGLRVINVDTPEPRFNSQYEHTIEQRNQANNQLRVIQEELERAATERQRLLAQLDQTRNAAYQQRRATLEGNLRQSEAEQERRLAQARANLTRMEGQAVALYNRAESRAEELQAQIEAEIAQTEAQIDALEANGIEAVMRQLARRLEGVRIQIQPYQNDPTPQTLRLENTYLGGAP